MTKFRAFLSFCTLAALLAPCTGAFAAVPWFPFGPDGGDARSLAGDPNDHSHVYMGAGNGWVYESHDGGRSWKRLARIAQRDDFMVDNIEVGGADGKRIIVGVYVTNKPDGGIYISKDGGHTWLESPQLHGHSIRALASAPSNHNILVAGALDGVYRSSDGGEHWALISPEGSKEIHEIESLAIDPSNPDVIYAGTWHLPWKTADGGKNWVNIKEGIIDDSDVFSIIIDPNDPKVVYASACSGIYKSESGAEPNPKLPSPHTNDRFVKVQGIPTTARRTRVLMQDPTRGQIVFAGTTEGLFRTSDAGKSWVRNTTPDTIINDVFVDAKQPDHVLLATDRQGVIVSDDGGFTFHASNKGFSSRQISSFAASHSAAGNVAVGVVNDKAYGGVFMSGDGGLTWMQRSDGLDGRDVFSLMRTADDTLLAGTSHGIFRFTGSSWVKSGLLLSPVHAAPVRVVKGKKAKPVAAAIPPASHFDGVVYALAASGNTVYAAAGDNLVVSLTAGEGWQAIPAMKGKELRYLAVQGGRVLVGGLRMISLSNDAGKTWKEIALPSQISLLTALTMDDSGRIWAGGREGTLYSEDSGSTWSRLPKLQATDVNNVYFDAKNHRVLVTVNHPTFAAEVDTKTMNVSYMDTGWNLRFLRPVGDHLLGATLFDGVVLQPRMMVTELSTVYKAAQ